MTQARPIIFLAFANDRTDDIGYLRNLPDEARRLPAALERVRTAGLCEVIVRQNATLEDILTVFQHPDYRNRIALFHYAGHANGYQLLLEGVAGATAAADAGGLALFLAQQRGLELVFLNGCSTQPQVQGLLDAGIATVIATSQAIDDAVATRFAECFYQSLAGSATVRQAYNEAAATLRTIHGDNTRHFYLQHGDGALSTAAPHYSRLPWMLYTREGAAVSEEWSLPKAANDPLFGLPPLPLLDLPETPFRHLAWFRREDAPIFFGRGHQIRELYNRITDAAGAPIILFYGQSGVGKSSLLAAGLLPRLEATHTVRYQRRERETGVLGALAAATGVSCMQPTADQLCTAWLQLEAEAQRPLVVLIDQVEELFTRPNPANPDELGQFLTVLQGLLGERRNRPQGKLVLAFRKEWLAEIEKHFAEAKLPRALLFLERLNRAGIIEAIEEATRDQRLVDYYGLTVQEGLAAEIADDLLADRGATVAPTLQILLSKLWERARARNYNAPCFDQDLYHELRHQGLLLGDFLQQQLVQLQNADDDALLTGLTLDFLAFHTTPLGTADQRTLSELREAYRHQSDLLTDLLHVCQDLYLLTDSSANQPAAEPATRLSHDTLAPLVRVRFDESNAPGQRARRILENRVVDWQGDKSGLPLDEADLATVEAGLAGMRGLTAAEERLLAVSREARRRKEAERQRLAAEKAAGEERELVLQQQSNRRLQMVVGILAVISLGLVGNLLYPSYVAWRIRGSMQLLPEQAVMIGVDPFHKEQADRQGPTFLVSTFWIEKYEITNKQYRQCVDVGPCSEPANSFRLNAPDFFDHPVVDVTAVQASTYCQWIGRRLPSEIEWERAARTDSNSLWLWKDESPPIGQINMPKRNDTSPSNIATVSVREFGERADPNGIFHLIGNVAEWTSSVFREPEITIENQQVWDGQRNTLSQDEFLITRGGSWQNSISSLTERSPWPVDMPDWTIGFRCAQDASPSNNGK